ncbi:hypothetical protein EUX98_g5935 [Antrodiella citrinella]|uniref:Arrestin-like N-terminal domain-containing protein n=1 Tax=Antrodiella citrinella TaxID=2447956 RepID=A0A4S4MQK3_9APHY|nr:hypothetical protein EUX98_g5935 [Antrodiella citrinella]
MLLVARFGQKHLASIEPRQPTHFQPKSTDNKRMAVNLTLPPGTYVGGQPVFGQAQLHFPEVLEDDIQEVHVKLRGYIFTRITRRNPQVGERPAYENIREVNYQHDTIDLVKENISIWSRANGPRPDGAQMLQIPFQFVLPPNALPSFDWNHGVDLQASISYFVEIVGVRDGMLHRNRRVRAGLAVLPPDPQGAMVNRTLRLRLPYEWRIAEAHKKIRRGIFGKYARVTAELHLPNYPSLPLFTPIPFVLRVLTKTKQEKFDAKDENPAEDLFPAPPTHPNQVEFQVRRYVTLRARLASDRREDHFADLAGMCKNGTGEGVEVHVNPRRWIPAKEDHDSDSAGSNDDRKGKWLQETIMRGTFVLNFPPGFETENLTLRYEINMKVDFPGIGNDLKIEVPLVVSSGLPHIPDEVAPMPPVWPNQGYPQALNLPKSYWEFEGAEED